MIVDSVRGYTISHEMKYLRHDYMATLWPAVSTKNPMLTVVIVVNVYPCWQVPKAFEILLGKRLGIGKKMFSTSESGEERTLKPWVNDGLGINTVFCIQCTVFNSDFFFFHIPANSSKRIVLNVNIWPTYRKRDLTNYISKALGWSRAINIITEQMRL